MNSATVPEIHLHDTKQVFSLNVGFSSVTAPFSILTHLWRDKGQGRIYLVTFQVGEEQRNQSSVCWRTSSACIRYSLYFFVL